MRFGYRTTGVITGALALAVLSTACGDVHADGTPGAAPAPAVSAVLRSAAADRCPVHPPARPAHDVSGTDATLEPLAANRLLLCGYGAPRPGVMVRTGGAAAHTTTHALVTDRTAVDRLRSDFNSLGAVPDGKFSCPADTGATVIATFTDGVHEVQLRDAVTGCSTVTNGSRTRWVGASKVNATVLALLNHSPSGG